MYRAEVEEKVGQVGWDWSLEWLHRARGNRKAQQFSWILAGLLVRMWGPQVGRYPMDSLLSWIQDLFLCTWSLRSSPLSYVINGDTASLVLSASLWVFSHSCSSFPLVCLSLVFSGHIWEGHSESDWLNQLTYPHWGEFFCWPHHRSCLAYSWTAFGPGAQLCFDFLDGSVFFCGSASGCFPQ